MAQLTRLLQCLLAASSSADDDTADDDGHVKKKMNSATDLCLSMLTLVVDSPFLDRPSAMEDVSDDPQSNLGLNLIDKFDQVATSAPASKKPSIDNSSSHQFAKRPRVPGIIILLLLLPFRDALTRSYCCYYRHTLLKCDSYSEVLEPMSDEDDEAWGFPLAAVSGLNLTPRPSSKRRTDFKDRISSTTDALSLLAFYLQHAWTNWVDQTASAGSSTAALLAGLICRTCHRAMECRSFREDSPLALLALRVLFLEHIGIGLAEKIALLISLEASLQRMR